MVIATPWIELHNACRVSDCFDARQGENHSYKVIPILPEPSLERLKVVQCFPNIPERKTQEYIQQLWSESRLQ
jgi:hypothetical protein